MPGENIPDWSTTAASNATADSSINWAEGMARATVNDSARSMMAAIAKKRNLENGSITTAGTANAQTVTSGLSYTSVPTGLIIRVKIGTSLTNTSTASLNMDGIGAVTILTQSAAALTGGELLAGSYYSFRYDGTNWILLDGRNTGRTLLSQQSASASSTIDFTGLDSTYDRYQIDVISVAPATDGVYLFLNVGTGGGPTYQASNYTWGIQTIGPSGSVVNGSTSDAITTTIPLTRHTGTLIGNNTGEHVALTLNFQVPGSSIIPSFQWAGRFIQQDGTSVATYGAAAYTVAGAFTALRFAMSSGNIASGTFNLWGWRKTP